MYRRIDLPKGIGRSEVRVAPIPHLELTTATGSTEGVAPVPRNHLAAEVSFFYNDHRVRPGQPGWFVTHPALAAIGEETSAEKSASDEEGGGLDAS